jgi:hypothetical protein
MDEKAYINFIINQMSALKDSAVTVLPAGHEALVALETCVETLKGEKPVAPVVQLFKEAEEATRLQVRDYADYDDLDDDYDDDDFVEPERVIPEGFTETEYDEFLAQQQETGVGVGDVVGTVVDDATGEVKEIGNPLESAMAAREVVAQIEEDQGEVEVENTIIIKYTNLSGDALTEANVHTIIDHPVSQNLKHLGAIQLITIRGTDDESSKEAVFGILEEGLVSPKALALNVAAYRGISVFPGIGAVRAVGTVNFL